MFDVIRKLLKALNSSQYSWQISLAAVLALAPGLTPAASLHNLLFYFLAFLINVNLGVFIVSIGLFAGVAYLADPLMESLGYWLLTLPALEGMWTVFYNNPWLKLTNFNDTLVLGSLVTALLLAVPAYFLFELLVKTYRGPISRITGKMPIVRSFLAFDEKAAELAKKPSPVRWWGAGLFVALTVPVAVFGLFFMDTVLKSQLESALSKPVGMQASIERLHTSLSPLSMTIEGIQIPDAKDPMKNSLEIERVAFNLDFAHLFHKKILIEEMTIGGVKLQTTRKAPAKKLPAPPPPPKEPEEPGVVSRFAADVADRLPDPKTVAKEETSESKAESERIQKRLEEIQAYWDQTAKTKFDKKALGDLEAEYKTLEARAGKIKNEKELKALLDDAKAFNKKVADRQKEYTALIEQFNADQKEAKALMDHLQALPGGNYEMLRQKYSFDTEGAFNMAGTLLGEDVQENLLLAREWYEKLSPYLKTAQTLKAQVKGEPLPKPERGKGRTVRFEEFNPRPEWLVQKAGFDLTTAQGSRLMGSLTGATDNQMITRQPMVVAVKSLQGAGYDTLSFLWVSERRKAVGEDTLEWVIGGMEKPATRVDKLFMEPAKADWTLQALIKEGRLEGKGRLRFDQTRLGLDNPRSEIEKLLDRTLGGVTRFDVDLMLSGRPLAPKIDLKTDLDNQLKNRFQAELEKRKKEFEARLKAEVQAAFEAQLKKAGASQKEIAAIEALIKGEGSALGVLEAKAGRALSEEALKKELQKQLDAERKKQEDEAKKRLEQEAKKLLPKR